MSRSLWGFALVTLLAIAVPAVAHVLVRLRNQEDQAGEEIGKKCGFGPRNQSPGGMERHASQETQEPQVEESRSSDQDA